MILAHLPPTDHNFFTATHTDIASFFPQKYDSSPLSVQDNDQALIIPPGPPIMDAWEDISVPPTAMKEDSIVTPGHHTMGTHKDSIVTPGHHTMGTQEDSIVTPGHHTMGTQEDSIVTPGHHTMGTQEDSIVTPGHHTMGTQEDSIVSPGHHTMGTQEDSSIIPPGSNKWIKPGSSELDREVEVLMEDGLTSGEWCGGEMRISPEVVELLDSLSGQLNQSLINQCVYLF